MFSRPASQSHIKVLLADDHHVVRSGIKSELERHADISVVGEAENGYEALDLVGKLHPDVLVLDISMPGLKGIEVAEKLYAVQDGHVPSILVLSAYCDREYVSSLFAAGAKGYLLKDESPARIVQGVRQVAQGEPALSMPVQKVLLTRRPKPQYDLSTRELEVLRLIAKGNTNEEIARELTIAEGTVKNHVTNIYRKLPSVHTRSEAVAWAWENRLVQID